MKKKVVYAGLLFLLFAFVVILASGGLVKASLGDVTSLNNVTIGSNGFYYSTLNLTNSSRFFMVVRSNASLNTYVFDSNAFQSWYSYMSNTSNKNPDGFSEAVSLEGKGAVAIFKNAKLMSLPELSNSSAPFYASNATLGPGVYSVVVDNSNGSASSLQKVYTEVMLPAASFITAKSLTAYKGSFVGVEIAGLAVIVLFILALLFIVYGLLSKQKPKIGFESGAQTGDVSSEEVDALYGSSKNGKSGKK